MNMDLSVSLCLSLAETETGSAGSFQGVEAQHALCAVCRLLFTFVIPYNAQSEFCDITHRKSTYLKVRNLRELGNKDTTFMHEQLYKI